MKTYAIIAAAGTGKRMKSDKNPIFLTIGNKPIIVETMERLNESKSIDSIVLVTKSGEEDELAKIKEGYRFDKVSDIVLGGETRQLSVYNGLKHLKDAAPNDLVLIQNATNPFVNESTIDSCIAAAEKYGAAVAAYKVDAATKKVNKKGFVAETIPADVLWQAQSPQVFKYSLLMKAYEKALEDKFVSKDDSSFVERIGIKVKVVECPYENIKIFKPFDLQVAKAVGKQTKTKKV